MTQEIVSDEDQMASALADIRSQRLGDDVVVLETAPTPEPAAATQQTVDSETQTAIDPIDQLEQAKAELHKVRSEIGRVDALNRKYQEANGEVKRLGDELAKARQTTQAPVDAEDARDRLAEAAEQVKDFPELASIVSAVSDALKKSDKKTEEVARRIAAQAVEPLEPLRREYSSRAATENQAAFTAAKKVFDSTYPTAVQVVQSDDFKQWLVNQPANIQHAFSKGTTPDEAMTVLDSYDMHLRRAGHKPVSQFEQPQSAESPAAATNAANTSRLQRAAALPSRQSGPQGGKPAADDFDASLAYFRSKRMAAQTASY